MLEEKKSLEKNPISCEKERSEGEKGKSGERKEKQRRERKERKSDDRKGKYKKLFFSS